LKEQRSEDELKLVPVVVAGAGAIQGPADRRGMRLGCGVLKNRSPKSVASVALRWILVKNQDRPEIAKRGYSRETVLNETLVRPREGKNHKQRFSTNSANDSNTQ
jgi:hypothetical protein